MDTIFEVEERVNASAETVETTSIQESFGYNQSAARPDEEEDNEVHGLNEDDWEADEILALKRYTPTTKDLLVLELYNSMLQTIIVSWEGKPCGHPKLKEESSAEQCTSSSKVSDSSEQQKNKSNESMKEAKNSTSKVAKSKSRGLKKASTSSDLKMPIKKKVTKIRKKTSSESGSIADPIQSESSLIVQEEISSEHSIEQHSKEVLVEEEIKFEPPDEQVTVVFTNGNVYTGRMSLKAMEGKGTFIWADGSKYEGDFVDNEMIGRGYIEWKDLSWYEGEVYQGLRHGNGLYVGAGDSTAYFGSWKMGCRDGKGFLYYDNTGQDSYEGEWVHDKPHGSGVHSYKSGAQYNGEWKNGFQNGVGVMVWPNKQVYRGFWAEGQRCGYGEYIWRAFLNLELAFPMQNIFMGWWENNEKHGQGILRTACGTIIMPSGLRYEGSWVHDKKHGIGYLTCRNGIAQRVTYEEDAMVKECSQETYDFEKIEKETDSPNTLSHVTLETYCSMPKKSTNSLDSNISMKKKSMQSKKQKDETLHSVDPQNKVPKKLQDSNLPSKLKNSSKQMRQICEFKKRLLSSDNKWQTKSSFKSITHVNFSKTSRDIKPESKQRKHSSKMKRCTSVALEEVDKRQQKQVENEDSFEIPKVDLYASEIEIDLSYHLNRFQDLLCNLELCDEEDDTSDSDQFITEDNEVEPQDSSSTSTFDSYFKDSLLSIKESSKNAVSEISSTDKIDIMLKKSDDNNMVKEIVEFEKKWLYRSLKQLEGDLRKLYHTYATVAIRKEPDFPVVLTRLMLWQFARDCRFSELTGCSLVELDQMLAKNLTSGIMKVNDPLEPLLFWQFLHYLLEVCWIIYSYNDSIEFAQYKQVLPKPPGILGRGFQKFVHENILQFKEKHVGLVLFEFRDLLPLTAVFQLYEEMGNPHSAAQFIRKMCHKSKCNQESLVPSQQLYCEGTNAATLGWDIFYLPAPETPFWNKQSTEVPDSIQPQDISVLGHIEPKNILKCLVEVCPLIMSDDSIVYIEYELTFLEFYEVLLLCTLCSIDMEKKMTAVEILSEKSEATQMSISKKQKPKQDKKKKHPKSS